MEKPTKTQLKPTATPDMAKQWRRELMALDKELKRVDRDYSRLQRATEKRIARIERVAAREIRALRRADSRLARGERKHALQLEKRQAILIGRLA